MLQGTKILQVATNFIRILFFKLQHDPTSYYFETHHA